MIHARIDTVEHRKIVGFETGTRAQFDTRHGGDPLWVFLDVHHVKYRANFLTFMARPWNYIIDTNGNIHLSDEPPIVVIEEDPIIPPGYMALLGRDGRLLKGADGLFLYGLDPDYVPPPAGMVYLTDTDQVFLKDTDNRWLVEPEVVTP